MLAQALAHPAVDVQGRMMQKEAAETKRWRMRDFS
jgi:hypothetical protein